MSGAHTAARGVAGYALPLLLVCALFALGLPAAWAEESAPPSAAPAPTLAPAPAQSAKADSVVATAAVHDTSSAKAPDKAPDSGAPSKTPPPVDRVENASSNPAEKSAEASVLPAAVSKPGEAPKTAPAGGAAAKAPKHHASVPKPGTKGVVVRGPQGPPKARAHSTASPALYDGLLEADRVDGELERTERLVGRAQKSIILSKNTRAMKLFASALDFQSDSRDAYKVRQYARAERLTLAARDFADRASRMVGPPREDPDYVEHVLRRTDDALDRAKDVLKTGAGRDAWSQHEDLKKEQKDAWKVFKNGDVGSAYKETLGVREGVLALLRQLQDLPVPRETAEKAIGGAQAALEQASKELGPKPGVEAVRLVRLANDYMTKARQSFSHGSYRSALLQAKVVERHVEHAVDVGRSGS